MNDTHASTMRPVACLLSLAVLAACSGTANGMLPPGTPGGPNLMRTTTRTSSAALGSGAAVPLRFRIPTGADAARDDAAGTLSPLTASVVVTVDGLRERVFETNARASECATVKNERLCTFALDTTTGTHTLAITTFSGARGSGTELDRLAATVAIGIGKANPLGLTVGPVVTNTSDHGKGSLRAAVGSANPGDTITFKLPNNATIALASPIRIAGTMTISGPGVTSGLTITGSGLHQIFQVYGNVAISGLTIGLGQATIANSPGGAIYNFGAVTLTNDVVRNSSSSVSGIRAPHAAALRVLGLHPHCSPVSAYGGAIYNQGVFVSSGTTYDSNVVQSDVANCLTGEGGAIYNDAAGTLESTGDTFSNNSALAGGAVFTMGVGGVSFTNDTFKANSGCNASSGCPTNCTTMTCTSSAIGEGAAIFDNGSGVTITSSTFTDNVAGGPTPGSQGLGGALLLAAGSPVITGSTFSGNLAGGGKSACSYGEGGAIGSQVDVQIDNDKFLNNKAAGDKTSEGGAIYAALAVRGTNDSFVSNAATATGSACSATSVGAAGGVYATTVQLGASTFAKNSATGNGEGAAGAIAASNAFVDGSAFAANEAIGTGTLKAAATGGGGAILSQTAAKLTNDTFTNNKAIVYGAKQTSVYGGAAILGGAATTTANTFSGNSVKGTAGSGTAAGAAITLVTGQLASTGDTFTGNTVTSTGTAGGGAVYVDGPYEISSAKFSSNSVKAPQAIGGALAVAKSGYITNDTFTSNSAVGALAGGGAIYDTAGALVTNTTITGNSASTLGGGIFTSGGDEISNAIISSNTVTTASAKHSGGGGIAGGGQLSIEQSTIENNTVTVSNTGMSGGGGILNAGPLEIGLSTMNGNAVLGSAPSSGGGAIYALSSTDVVDATIAGNSSKIDGGGIEIAANATVKITNATLYQNTASLHGGNIDNLFAMTLTNSIVAGGKAAVGKDVANPGTLTSGDFNIVQFPVSGHPIGGTTTHDKAADPLLLALANNGGFAMTNADQATSPGTGYIPFSGGLCNGQDVPIDARGYARGAKGHCDVGAYEFAGVATSLKSHLRHRAHGAAASGTSPLPHPHLTLPALRV